MQVDKIDKFDESIAWAGNRQIRVDPKKRATSAFLRKTVREAFSDRKPHEAGYLREFIDSRQGDGEYYSQGQFAGVLKNMANSGELAKLSWGMYAVGPEFENKTSSLFIEVMSANQNQIQKRERTIDYFNIINADLARAEKYTEPGFSSKQSEIVKKIEQEWNQTRQDMDKVKLSELTKADFDFVLDFKQLDEMVQAFCAKYRKPDPE